jgi:hypothetical protein
MRKADLTGGTKVWKEDRGAYLGSIGIPGASSTRYVVEDAAGNRGTVSKSTYKSLLDLGARDDSRKHTITLGGY